MGLTPYREDARSLAETGDGHAIWWLMGAAETPKSKRGADGLVLIGYFWRLLSRAVGVAITAIEPLCIAGSISCAGKKQEHLGRY